MGGGKTVSQSSSSQSGTHFPTSFVDDYTDYFGFGFTIPQIANSLPKTQSPFFPTPAPSGNPLLTQQGPGLMPPTGTPATAPAPTGPRTFRVADLQSAYDMDPEKFMDVQRLMKKGLLKDNFTIEEFDKAVAGDKDLSGRSRGNLVRARMDLERRDALLTKSEAAGGTNPSTQLSWGSNPLAAPASGGGGGGMGVFDPSRVMNPPQWQANPEAMAGRIDAGMERALGYLDPKAIGAGFSMDGMSSATGAAAQGYGVAAPGPIPVTYAQAAQGDIAGGDWDRFEKAQMEARYNPINRQLEREYGAERDQTKAQMAQLGMLDAMPWKLTDIDDRESRDRLIALQDSANQAVITTVGLKNANLMANLDRQQQANLFNAGQSNDSARLHAQLLLTANVESARNMTSASIASAQNATSASIANAQIGGQLAIARGNAMADAAMQQGQIAANMSIAGTSAYLQALGINVQQEQSLRGDWLNYLGLAQKDLQRLDYFSLTSSAMVYDIYLRQQGILAQAGGYGTSRSTSSQGGSGLSGIGGLAGTLIGAGIGASMGNPLMGAQLGGMAGGGADRLAG